MNRREFIMVLSGALVAWPLGARAQQPRKLPTIGFLGSTTASTAARASAAVMFWPRWRVAPRAVLFAAVR